jgi:hypothetical protein
MPGAEPPSAPPAPQQGAETSWWQRAAAKVLSQRAEFGTLAATGALLRTQQRTAATRQGGQPRQTR